MPKDEEKIYTSRQLRVAAASEVINCMGWAMECGNAEVFEWARTLAFRIPTILDAPEDPKPAPPEKILALAVAAREKWARIGGGYPGYSEEKATDEHREHHALLHDRFDQLIADYLRWNPKKTPSNTTMQELMEWSHQQTITPQEGPLPSAAAAAAMTDD